MEFKKQEDAARDHYASQATAMTKAMATTQNEQAAHRRDFDKMRDNEEKNRDKADLGYLNASTMQQTATLKAGMSATLGLCWEILVSQVESKILAQLQR